MIRNPSNGRAVRLQKYLARAGVSSRRGGERLIEAGRVSVDGTVVTELGTKVVPGEQEVQVDGHPVEPEPIRWVMLYKPPGYLSARSDDRGRATVYSLLPDELSNLFHVGRLDQDSEGLLIFTNEGVTAHRLLHPSFEVARRYRVRVGGELGAEERRRLREGVELEDGLARPERVEVEPAGPGVHVIELLLREGRKREVRRIMDALGLSVRRLTRVSFGPLQLDLETSGEWRDLTDEEVHALRSAVGLEGSGGGH